VKVELKPDGGTLADTGPETLAIALSRQGLWIDLGALTVRTQSNCRVLSGQLQAVYSHFPFVDHSAWADLHVQLIRSRGLRRWVRPQVSLWCDGHRPFNHFPADSALTLHEWGCNWLIGRRLNDLLLLHAGVVERDGFALILPALPGSGKSTLTAALSLRSWRLLSDEFGAFDPEAGVFRAVLKPVSLKNQSIEVIRRFSADAALGPPFLNTHKGTVAHLAPPRDAVLRRHQTARPGAVILPRWSAGSVTRLEPLAEHVTFPALAFNAFNYSLLGAMGFRSAVRLVRQCPAWRLTYSDLDDALRTIDALRPQIIEHQAATAI
jgi:HprK-related kinase A